MIPNLFSRRSILKASASGFGYLAFAGMSTWAAEKAVSPLAPKPPHFGARAKRVIFLCMEGAPSHVDTFDYKPTLAANDGKPFTNPRGLSGKLMGSPWSFKQHGHSGQSISELFPEVATCADDLCVLRGMQTDVPAHPQAYAMLHTGSFQFKRPSMGAWSLYGLGTENENLPGFITISPPANLGGPTNYGSSFLPAVFQGTPIGTLYRPPASAKLSNIKNPRHGAEVQRVQLDYIQSLNQSELSHDADNPSVEGAIQSLELAFRMQGELPKVMDISRESAATKELYGIGAPGTENFAEGCLLARRCVEAGVRFVEVTSPAWDHHKNIRRDLPKNCQSVDKPIAGLLKDLKSRGLLKDTLVIWGGEFGRTPYAQNGDGRDHNHRGYTMWFAGGGVKGGLGYGNTDELGYEAVENKVHIHDLHATILALLGLDHEKLTFRYAGREMRLTDVKGNVVRDIMV